MVADSFFVQCLYNDYQRFIKINELLSDEHNLSLIELDDVLEESFRLIHTMKGTLGFLKLNVEMKQLHLFEELYLKLIKNKNSTTKDDLYILNLKVTQVLKNIMDTIDVWIDKDAISIKELFSTIKNEFDVYNHTHNKNIKIMLIHNGGHLCRNLAQDVYQIAYQIIKNAIKHGYFNKEMILKINVHYNPLQLKLKIINDGLQINYSKLIKNAKEKNKVLNSYENILYSSTTTTQEKRDELAGTGVGLNCVKRLIDKHHGQIRSISTEDYTGFYILLPL